MSEKRPMKINETQTTESLRLKVFPLLKIKYSSLPSKVNLDSRRSQMTMMENQQVQIIRTNAECVLA